MDLSNITFNKNHKIEAAAKDAATGIKLLTFAFLASAIVIAIAVVSLRTQTTSTGISIVSTVLTFAAFAGGCYGAYLCASALEWSGFITGIIVLGAIVPYLKFIAFIVLMIFSIDLIRKADYRFSFFGPLRKRAVA